MSQLTIEISEQRNVSIVHLSGSLNMDEARYLNLQLGKLLDGGHYRLVLDLEKLTFISSMGLGALIQIHGKCRQNGGNLVLVNSQAAVIKLFRTTRLDSLFQLCDSVPEAMNLCMDATRQAQPPGPPDPL